MKHATIVLLTLLMIILSLCSCNAEKSDNESTPPDSAPTVLSETVQTSETEEEQSKTAESVPQSEPDGSETPLPADPRLTVRKENGAAHVVIDFAKHSGEEASVLLVKDRGVPDPKDKDFASRVLNLDQVSLDGDGKAECTLTVFDDGVCFVYVTVGGETLEAEVR